MAQINNNGNNTGSPAQSHARRVPRQDQRNQGAGPNQRINKPALNVFADKPEKQEKMKINIIPVVIIAVLTVAAAVGGSIYALDQFNLIRLPEFEETTRADYAITAAADGYEESPEYEEKVQVTELGNETACEHALLVNITTGEIIAQKLPDEIAYPASITKVMTAIVAIETIEDLESEVRLDYDMFQYIYSRSASTAGFYNGERVKAIDLLYGLILPSGADAALGLAKLAAGSEEDFVKLMNEKCEELKLTNTHFTNCTGLDDINHYSTCTDLYRILRYALKNQTFYNVFTTMEYTTSPTNIHGSGLTVNSTIKYNYDKEGLPLGYVIGGKTGYTVPAKQCMATLALKDGNYYALIVLGCGDGTTKRAAHALCTYDLWNRFLGEYPSVAEEAAQ